MLRRIPLDEIVPNPDQPRKIFDTKQLNDLAASIESEGLKQPITVRPVEGGYMVVMGERRWRAHKLLQERGKLDTILCHVRRMDEDQMALEAIIENLQRVDIKPMEEARAFQSMLDRGFTPEDLARRLGLGQAWRITYRTRLLKLDESIQKLVETGQVTTNAASELAKLDRVGQMRVLRGINAGTFKTDAEVSAAVQAVIDKLSQTDIFGGAGGSATDDEVATVNRMEAKVDSVARMVSAGWKDGECIVARKVSPDRASRMADQIAAIRKHLAQMERELRQAAAQAEIALDAA